MIVWFQEHLMRAAFFDVFLYYFSFHFDRNSWRTWWELIHIFFLFKNYYAMDQPWTYEHFWRVWTSNVLDDFKFFSYINSSSIYLSIYIIMSIKSIIQTLSLLLSLSLLIFFFLYFYKKYSYKRKKEKKK